MTISTPVVNGGLMYVNGMRLAAVNTTTFTVSQGFCRNSTNVNDINIGLPLNVGNDRRKGINDIVTKKAKSVY